MTITATTDSLAGYDLNHAFALVKEAGLDGIEVAVTSALFDTYDAAYLQELSNRHQLPIRSLLYSGALTDGRAEKLLTLAQTLGITVVSLSAAEYFDLTYKKWLESEMRQLRQKYQIHIALTNPPAGQNQLWLFPKYAASSLPELKQFPDLTLDTSNTLEGDPLLEAYASLKDNLVHIHLSNARAEKRHQLPESGTLPLESLITRLARDAFAGDLSLRFRPEALGCGDTEKVIANLKEAKAFITKYSITA